jgi:hypothetical protein
MADAPMDVTDHSAAAAAAPPDCVVIPGTYCELHGAQASEEVQKAATEAACLELPEGAKIQIFEGGSLWVDGSAGVEPSSGQPKASALIEKGGRLELFGLADLTMTGQTAIEPAPPRMLAQVIHS